MNEYKFREAAYRAAQPLPLGRLIAAPAPLLAIWIISSMLSAPGWLWTVGLIAAVIWLMFAAEEAVSVLLARGQMRRLSQ